MWVEFVVGSLLYSERLFRFSLPSKTKQTLPNSDSTRNQVDEEPLSECAAYKPLLIYFKVTFNLN